MHAAKVRLDHRPPAIKAESISLEILLLFYPTECTWCCKTLSLWNVNLNCRLDDSTAHICSRKTQSWEESLNFSVSDGKKEWGMGMRRYWLITGSRRRLYSKDISKMSANFKAPECSTKQMHLLLKNTIKPLFAIISEFEAKGKFATFALTARGVKSHYLSRSQCGQGSSLHILSRQSTVLVLSPESR